MPVSLVTSVVLMRNLKYARLITKNKILQKCITLTGKKMRIRKPKTFWRFLAVLTLSISLSTNRAMKKDTSHGIRSTARSSDISRDLILALTFFGSMAAKTREVATAFCSSGCSAVGPASRRQTAGHIISPHNILGCLL